MVSGADLPCGDTAIIAHGPYPKTVSPLCMIHIVNLPGVHIAHESYQAFTDQALLNRSHEGEDSIVIPAVNLVYEFLPLKTRMRFGGIEPR